MNSIYNTPIDNGEVVEDHEEEPKARDFNVGYGKATVHSDKLIITNKDVLVPNSFEYANDLGTKVRAGYFSHSALNTYRRCQMLYFHKYVLKERKYRSAVKMWGGSAMHATVEKLMQSKIDNPDLAERIRDEASMHIGSNKKGALSSFNWDSVGPLPVTEANAISTLRSSYNEFVTEYETTRARVQGTTGVMLPDVKYDDKIATQDKFLLLYDNAVKAYMQSEFIMANPKKLEELILYHLPLHSGGSVPIVGFIDAIEETDFIGEHILNCTDKDALKELKKIDNGEKMIVDHKCGSVVKTYENARTDQQLTLYSLATGIDLVGFDNIKLGTTGGKNPKNAKPAQIIKTFARRSARDHEKLIDDFNAIIKGISAGNFDKSGMCNSMVCGPTQCEYYCSKECFGK